MKIVLPKNIMYEGKFCRKGSEIDLPDSLAKSISKHQPHPSKEEEAPAVEPKKASKKKADKE